MSEQSPVKSLQTFQEEVFARIVLFDMPYPVFGAVLITALNSWLLYGEVAGTWIVLWVLFVLATTLLRLRFEKIMRAQVDQGAGYAATLRGFAALSLPTGALSGMFACLYFDGNDPLNMVVLSTYMSVIVVGSVVPTAMYLPAFYLLVLTSHGPYWGLLLAQGGNAHWVILGVNAVFLIVTFQYAHAANKMHRDTARLQYERLQLIADLDARKSDAENASKTKSLFLAGVSHDLKQPIRALGLYLGVLEHAKGQQGTPVLDKVVLKMQSALSELHSQVTRLLELSRLESGTVRVQIVRLELGVLFASLQHLFEGEASSKGVRLVFASLSRLHSQVLWVDQRMLESILQNLISNAIKHTAVGTVYVGVRQRKAYRDGRQLCIEVRDSGSGIPLEQQKYLFDAYRSFDDRHASESHGLGLAIARAQATYLGASIAVKSALGRGSVFTVCGISTHNSKQMHTPSTRRGLANCLRVPSDYPG